jgi:histidinol-phosphate aminotransferase
MMHVSRSAGDARDGKSQEAIMSVSRRAFVQTLGVGGAGLACTRFVPAGGSGLLEAVLAAADATPLLLHGNENPVGPSRAAVEAMRGIIGATAAPVGRYPTNKATLIKSLATKHDVSQDNVMVACGSTELLRIAVQVFTSKSSQLVTGAPTYEECTGYAQLIQTPVKAVKLDDKLRLDLPAMAAASSGAGLVYINNPNNPTATIQPASAIDGFISEVLKASPKTTILVDEAYHDYVTDPAHKSQIPLAVQNPRVVVARTFSKAYGMAGLRIGYVIAHPDALKVMKKWEATAAMSVLSMGAAIASITDQAHIPAEVKRNTEARQFTLDWFKKAGFDATDSQANFIFVNTKRPAAAFRDACRANGVLVGRDFPPFAQTHARISIGTIEEMRKATEVFGKVLSTAATAAA